MRHIQTLIGPFFTIVGNGCQFKELWNDINVNNRMAHMDGFDIELEHIMAPIGLPPLAPHIIGKATKKMTTSK